MRPPGPATPLTLPSPPGRGERVAEGWRAASALAGSRVRGIRRVVFPVFLTFLLLWGPPAPASDPPQRIVSLNLCSDQLLMLLAEPGRIVSLSFLAADPASSAMAEQARGFRLNHGRAEEILPLAPDLVLAGTHAARVTVDLLRRLGHRVVELPLATGLDDVAAHIRIVARAIGAEARGERLIAAFEARLAAVPPPPPDPRPVAVLFESNGITAGRNTLPDAAMTAAGLDNLAALLAVGGVGRVPLEVVVAERPDALVIGRLRHQAPSLAALSLEHPALRKAAPANAVISIPEHLWACPTPAIAEAVETLAGLRARLPAPAARDSGARKREPGT